MEYNGKMDSYDTMGNHGPSEMRKRLQTMVTSDTALVLIALEGDKAIGYSISVVSQRPSFFDQSKYGFISDMAVTSEERRTGIGQAMLEKIKDWFKSKNIHRVETSVVATNNIANSFWNKQGFRDYERVIYLNI